MIAAILDRRGVLHPDVTRSVLTRAGATAVHVCAGFAAGWRHATLSVDAHGVTLIDGVAVGDQLTTAFDHLRDDDASSLSALRAPFAGVTWDTRRRSLRLARDHFGRQALHVASQGGVTYVASEIGPLLRMLPRQPDPDPVAIGSWLGYQPLGRRTLFAGTAPLLPGHTASLMDDGTTRVRAYWNPTPRPGLTDLSVSEAADVVWDALRAALAAHTSAHRRCGVLLSGGLDSAAVLAGMAALSGPVPPVFSAVFPDHREADESAYIDGMARFVGAEQARASASLRSVLDDSERFLETWAIPQDFPQRGFFHGARVAAAHAGVQQLLDGEGGDELFGSDPFVIGDLARRGRVLAAAQLAREIPGMGDRVSLRAGRVVLRTWVLGGLLSPSVRGVFRRQEGRQFINDSLLPPTREAVLRTLAESHWSEGTEGSRAQARMSYSLVHRPRQTASMDYARRINHMAGVVHDSPMLDPDLLATMLGLSPALAFNRARDKELLRLALVGRVPDQVRLRVDKTGFNRLPIESLNGVDRVGLLALLDHGSPLGAFIDVASVRRDAEAGPGHYRHGATMWLMHMWRMATLAQWLRSLDS